MADKRATVTEPGYWRNVGVLNATRVGGTRRPRTSTMGAYAGQRGMMKVTRADGSEAIIPASGYGRKQASARKQASVAKLVTRRSRDIERMAEMGTIHEGEA